MSQLSDEEQRLIEERRQRGETMTSTERDRAMVRLDEAEIKERCVSAFDRFVQLGYETSLIGEAARGATTYWLQLEPSKASEPDVAISRLIEIAEQFRLDLVIGKSKRNGIGLALYPRL